MGFRTETASGPEVPAFNMARLLQEVGSSAQNQTTHAPGEARDFIKAAQGMRVTLVFILAGFVTIWLLCAGLVWHMRVNRTGALKGDAAAARKTILPAFEPVLVFLSVFNGIYIIIIIVILSTKFYGVMELPLVLETFYSGNQFMFVIVLVLMFQKSISIQAIRRSIVISLLMTSYNVLYVFVVTTFGRKDQRKAYTIGLLVIRSLLMIPFLYALVRPPSRATKRTIRELCFVTLVYFLLTVVLMILILNPKTESLSHLAVYVMLTWVAFCPLVVWRVLKADTEYWRGMGQRACALQDIFQRENRLNEHVSSEGLHVLIEMHRKHVIDFAYLDIGNRLGVGSTSTVFQGTLKAKTHVAVKAYMPRSCSEDVVAAFSHEAAMCSALDHPNIVKFHGICVAPPTICLLFELCQGNLADTLRDQARRQNTHLARQQLLISIGYMLDAARAVAYLHSFSPPFIHRDIRPSNLLLDAACNVKLSDLGGFRCVTKLHDGILTAGTAKTAILEDKRFLPGELASPLGTTLSVADSPWNGQLENGSADYVAPEVLSGKGACYGEAADVYSLGITMWDILQPSGNRFPTANCSHNQVFDSFMHGSHPTMNNEMPARLRDILVKSWHSDPALRPSAKHVVAVLEDIQEELCARLVLDLVREMCQEPAVVRESVSRPVGPTFPGSFIVDQMIDRRSVRSPAEAIRMGNALMDSNVLHHVRHARGFENSATTLYYFDLDEAQLNLPSRIDRSHGSSSILSADASSIPMLTCGSHAGEPRTSHSFVRTRNGTPCMCRQLGQRLRSGTSSGFLQRRQFKAAPEPTLESHTLTAALLVEDEASHVSDYDSLDTIPGTAATVA